MSRECIVVPLQDTLPIRLIGLPPIVYYWDSSHFSITVSSHKQPQQKVLFKMLTMPEALSEFYSYLYICWFTGDVACYKNMFVCTSLIFYNRTESGKKYRACTYDTLELWHTRSKSKWAGPTRINLDVAVPTKARPALGLQNSVTIAAANNLRIKNCPSLLTSTVSEKHPSGLCSLIPLCRVSPELQLSSHYSYVHPAWAGVMRPLPLCAAALMNPGRASSLECCCFELGFRAMPPSGHL